MRAALLLVTFALLAGCTSPPATPPGPPGPGTPPVTSLLHYAFEAPVDLDAVGYEPSISVDDAGAIYWTAHKDLTKPQTWPYPGSWFQVSRDNGTTWENPASPVPNPLLPIHQAFLGDEGDIAVDARGWVYFVDTYLADNHLHVWSDQGRTWQSSQAVQKSTGADDRPWVTAQGEGLVHYLGNNGSPVNGGRHWYYRSADAGLTWSQGMPITGNGWSTIDAERSGPNLYVATEGGGVNAAGDLLVWASHDQGQTWEEPVPAGSRVGEGREYPIVAAAPEGVVWVLWLDCGSASNCADDGGSDPTHVSVARSTDAGATWQSWDVTPFDGYLDYPTVCAGKDGAVAVTFYASKDLPLSASSQWYLFAGSARALNGTPVFEFQQAAPEVVYTGQDLHALHDFYECAIGPDGALHIAYMHSQDTTEPGQDYGIRDVFYVRGVPTPS